MRTYPLTVASSQAGYGSCTADDVSSDGICGGSKGYKCLGSGFGDCCSSAGYCGSTNDHCEARCQMDFGRCTVAGVPVLILDPETGSTYIPINTSPLLHANVPLSLYHSNSIPAHFQETLRRWLLWRITGFKMCGHQFWGMLFGGWLLWKLNFSLRPRLVRLPPYGSLSSQIANRRSSQTPFSSACLSSKVPSVDGTCGSGNGDLTCAGGPFEGRCCSVGGWCGSDADHCNSGWYVCPLNP